MPQHRIMLFGAAGHIGQSIQHLSKQLGFPHNWELGLFSRTDCDITNPSALRAAMQGYKPHLVIDAASVTPVDEAEQNQDVATAVNFHAVAQMAAQCSALDVPMIYLSSDHVFDGQKTTPYLPDDQMNPLNHFGASKMMGEESLRHELPWHVILRVSSVFSPFRRNILTNTLKAIENKDELRALSDRINGPTSALQIAKAIIVIGARLLAGKTDGFGTFHLSGAPACSHFELAEAIMEAYAPYTARRPKITAITSAEVDGIVMRPAYSVLDCTKIEAVYGVTQQPWRDGIKESLDILFKGGRTPRLPRKVE